MKWFNNMRVGRKVLATSFIFIIIILVISGNSYINMKKADSSFGYFYDNRFITAVTLDRIKADVLEIKINMLLLQRAAESKDQKEIEQINNTIKFIAQNYKKNLEALKSSGISSDEKKLVQDFEAGANATIEFRLRFSKALSNGDLKESAYHLMGYLDGFNKAMPTLENLIELQIKEGKRIEEEQAKETTATIRLIIILLVSSLAIGILVTIVLSRAVSGPVNKGLAFARKIAVGDFTERILIDQTDELGMLSKALNSAADTLEKTIIEIIHAANNLAQAVEQITGGNQNLSQRTSEQASALEEVAATIEQANSSINQNYENSLNANRMSEESSSVAIQGGELVNETVLSINEVNISAKKIGEITTVINEIAFQTNLLALNAAVEAARAGEQGRGFAVVAGEVRNLAQRAGNAAKEIALLINDTVLKIETGTEKTNKSGQSLQDIIESVKRVAELINDITASSNEQKQGMQQISTAITDLDNMTQHNAALVEETASASEEMANQAQELLNLMSRFMIRESIDSDTTVPGK
jgi:methyl-accepting chemotaxis protein